MNVNEFLNQFLTIDNQHFKKRHKENPIELQDFYKILKWYLKFNSDNNLIIADVNDNYKQFGWVYIRDNSNLYRINADTKLKGLKTLYKNKDNALVTIPNQRTGKRNKVTNNSNNSPIEGLYMYKD